MFLISQAPIQGRPYHHILHGLFSFYYYYGLFPFFFTHLWSVDSPRKCCAACCLFLQVRVFFFLQVRKTWRLQVRGRKLICFFLFFACFVCRWGRRGTPSSGPRAPRTKSAVPSARVSTCRSSPKSSPSLGTRPLRLRFLVSPHFFFFFLFFCALGTEILAIFGHSTVETEISGQGSAFMCSLVFFLFFCWYFFFIS